jgi:proteasome lid subunit RPN8/RPN11
LSSAGRHGPDVVARIVALCESRPERESCGLVLALGEARQVVEIPNVADRYHAANPALHPRTARDGYVMDPGALLRVHRALDADDGRIVAVWHSHVEGGAELSVQDRSDALIDGVPVLPGAEYVVVGLRAGRAREIRAYRFDGRDYVDASGWPGERPVD